MNRPGIIIIGAGMVGSSCAASIASRRLGNVFLYDIVKDLAVGRSLDINHFLPSRGSDSFVTGCNRIEDAIPADIVVITAGLARKAGMTRLDLLRHNAEAIGALAPKLNSLCPSAKVLIVTNPVDVITWYFKKLCPGMQVFGLGCSLDMVRFQYLVARAARVSAESVSAMVIGAHDDNMIPLTGRATIGGIPMETILGAEEVSEIVAMTRTAGSTIVNLMKEHSGHYAAGEITAQIVESMAQDRKKVFPVSIKVAGEYGYRDICLALPCIVDESGVRKVIELELNEQERNALNACAMSITSQIESLKGQLA